MADLQIKESWFHYLVAELEWGSIMSGSSSPWSGAIGSNPQVVLSGGTYTLTLNDVTVGGSLIYTKTGGATPYGMYLFSSNTSHHTVDVPGIATVFDPATSPWIDTIPEPRRKTAIRPGYHHFI